MTILILADQANAALDAMETALGASPKFEVWSGTIPGTIAAAPAGTRLVNMSLPSDAFANASSGQKTKTGTWSGLGIAAGNAAFWRLCTNAGVAKYQGSLTATGGGGDATIDNVSIAVGQTITVNSFTLVFPNVSA